MKIKKISKNGIKPTWDVHVPVEEHYITKNGCVSHNTASILGNNESFEPYTNNIYVRKTLSGEFTMVNRHLIQALEGEGLWTPEMKDAIIRADGSVQNIQEIPKSIRERFKTVWEIPQRSIIDQAADRGAFICQSQSLNLHVPEGPRFRATLKASWLYGWMKGLKTLSYYIRTQPAVGASKTLAVAALPTTTITKPTPAEDEDCLVCSA